MDTEKWNFIRNDKKLSSADKREYLEDIIKELEYWDKKKDFAVYCNYLGVLEGLLKNLLLDGKITEDIYHKYEYIYGF